MFVLRQLCLMHLSPDELHGLPWTVIVRTTTIIKSITATVTETVTNNIIYSNPNIVATGLAGDGFTHTQQQQNSVNWIIAIGSYFGSVVIVSVLYQKTFLCT